jgi:hypothetical protein
MKMVKRIEYKNFTKDDIEVAIRNVDNFEV